MPYFTLWMLDCFNNFWVSNSLDPDQARHFGSKLFAMGISRHQNVWLDLGSKCLQRFNISRQQKLAKSYKKLVDTTFWLKPWLKLISFGYNFFYLAKVLATTNSEPELALR